MLMDLSRDAAKASLDGGIDATAALTSGVAAFILRGPCWAKKTFGNMMASVLAGTVDVAVQTYPELKPNKDIWMEIARECAARRV